MSERKRGADALDEIGTRLTGLAEKLREAIAQAGEGGVRDVTIDTPAGPVTARSAVRIRVGGLAGQAQETPSSFEFKTPDAAPPEPAAREPVVETFEEDSAFVLTIELPGVAEADVAIAAEPGALVVETHGLRRYRARVELPAGLEGQAAETRLANGILEIRIPKERA